MWRASLPASITARSLIAPLAGPKTMAMGSFWSGCFGVNPAAFGVDVEGFGGRADVIQVEFVVVLQVQNW